MRRVPYKLLVLGALGIGPIAQSAQAASVADFYELAKPAGKGPFPAVVLAPGCGGFHDEYSPPVFDKYRKRLVYDGFAVINVDFTKAHDIPGCANDKGFLISSEDYAKDIVTAVTDLAKDGSIDPTRIHLIGWSFGGGASFSALALAERDLENQFRRRLFPLLQRRSGLEAVEASADVRRFGRLDRAVRPVQGLG